ncbi:restriction endonuclease PLD domain-containing protein [Psychrobacillus sp. MER TA 171]|uniref:restriction endonuclease PLD domain-containing protein n=1 Tax=Psychrobacillus sp. MER TA 171 TaxID=2939577 RepID=UPI00203ACEBB|nr:restriction endonuclease PLD domain-containing protein [Psychrobacillus sp. MER TA 171]MCM3358675.1 NgoFVII family restriction endonuclease [Psychrobacillus sp. MER TA 171]
MYLTTDLEHSVFHTPYRHGFRKLRILTGYASSAFLYHILENYQDIEIELIIGMSRRDGIPRWDHERYQQIVNENPRISIFYQISSPPIHTKIYHWYTDGLFDDSLTFVGSANFSWGGFRDQHELMVEVNFPNIDEVFAIPTCLICIEPTIEDYIRFTNIYIGRRGRVRQRPIQVVENNDLSRDVSLYPYVDLPLLLNNDTAIHERSGLNWGQRPGREPNQAYIPVSSRIHQANPNFFPPTQQEFNMLTDDGHQLICVVAQSNRKAIETPESNSILGRYFRERLRVPLGTRVDAQDVIDYGRTSVRVYKIDDETYFMDFGV